MFGFGSVGGGAAPGGLNNAQIKQRPPSSALNLNQFQKVRPTAVAGNASIGTQRPMMQQSTAQMMSSHFGSIGGGASRPAASAGSSISGASNINSGFMNRYKSAIDSTPQMKARNTVVGAARSSFGSSPVGMGQRALQNTTRGAIQGFGGTFSGR